MRPWLGRDRHRAPAVGRLPCRNRRPVLQARVPASCDEGWRAALRWSRRDQQEIRLTMDKHLLGAVWGLPASFALPSVAACRRALALIRPRL